MVRGVAFGRRGAVLAVCGVCAAVGLIQWRAQGLPLPSGAGGLSYADLLRTFFGVDAELLGRGALWQPLTYAFLHGGWLHLAANLFGLLITGLALERVLGASRWFALFVLGAAAGAVGFLLSAWLDPRIPVGTVCIGASAAVAASIGAATALAPRARVVLWILFIPVPLRAGWLFPLFFVFFACEAWLWPGTTAYGAHLGGWAAGLLLGLFWRD